MTESAHDSGAGPSDGAPSGAPDWRRRLRGLGIALLASAAALLLGASAWCERETVVPLSEIVHVGGHRYRAPLPDGLPEGDHHDAQKTWIKCSPGVLFEDGTAIGAPHTLHAEIERDGGGLYSHWIDSVNFSSSDNTDPRENGRRYELRFPIAWLARWLGGAAWLAALGVVLLALGARRSVRIRLPSARTVLARLALAIVSLVVAFVGAEMFVRLLSDRPVVAAATLASGQSIAPILGDVLTPGARFVYDGQVGNVSEFHTEETVNAFGFLDVEHAIEKPPGTFRILVLGDSYVQADQVAMPDKWPRRLEALLDEFGGPDVEVVALGRDGAGVGNQYGYWRGLGRHLDPDVVLIMMTPRNDFSDDSLLIQSINRNFDADHPPRFWFRGPDEDFEPVFPDVESRSFRIAEPPTALQEAFSWLRRRSQLVARVSGTLERRGELPAALVRRGTVASRTEAELEIAETPLRYHLWCYADESTWPDWQRDGYAATRHALGVLQREIEQERGIPFLACLNTEKRDLAQAAPWTVAGFELRYERPRLAAERLLAELGIPTLVLYDTFRRRPEPERAHWQVDGHWNETGNAWAAEDVGAWLVERGLIPDVAAPSAGAARASASAPASAEPLDGEGLPVFRAGDAVACGDGGLPCEAALAPWTTVGPGPPYLNPAAPSVADGMLTLPSPGVYRLAVADGVRTAIATSGDVDTDAAIAFAFAVGATSGGSRDVAAFRADPRGTARRLFRRAEPLDVNCGPSAEVMGFVLDVMGVEHRLVQWLGEDEQHVAHQSLEVRLDEGWTLFDPHLGLRFEPGMSALEVFDRSRASVPLADRIAECTSKASWEPDPTSAYERYDAAFGFFAPDGGMVMLEGDEGCLEALAPVALVGRTVAELSASEMVRRQYAGDTIEPLP